MSGMTLSSMSPVRNPQRPPSTPLLDPPPSWHTSNWDINMKFSGYLPWGKKHHSWCQEWPSPKCLRSGTLNVLQVPSFLTPPSWHTSNKDINTKFSGYLPRGKKTSFMMSGMTKSAMSLVRNPQHPPCTPLLDPPSWHTSNRYPHEIFMVSSLG